MASTFCFILLLTMALFTSPSVSSYSSSPHLKLAASTISAAPSYFAESPAAATPALSPDVTPLLPGGSVPSPTGSSIPTIPSSPSPPNPDDMAAAAPAGFAISPAPQPMSSSISFLPNSLVSLSLVLFWIFWFAQLLAK